MSEIITPEYMFGDYQCKRFLIGFRGKQRQLMYRALQEAVAESIRLRDLSDARSAKLFPKVAAIKARHSAAITKANTTFATQITKLNPPVMFANNSLAYCYTSLKEFQATVWHNERENIHNAIGKFRQDLLQQASPASKPTKLDPASEALLATFKLSLQKALPSGPPQPTVTLDEPKS